MNYFKVLIVDNHTDTLDLINKILISTYPEVELHNAIGGKFALELVSMERPDIIITAWQMPGMTGLELIKILKSDLQTASIQVICAGEMLEKADFINALSHGAIDCIQKPIDETMLIARINSILNNLNLCHRPNIEFEKLKRLEIKKLEDQIENANKEINTRTLLLSKYNEMLRATSERLKNLPFCNNSQYCANYIAEMISDIQMNVFSQKGEDLILTFKKLYPAFFNELSQKHPDLSKNESRLCALLKLGFSTKEISAITMQSERAIEMGRHRLRKKLGIGKDINFTKYL